MHGENIVYKARLHLFVFIQPAVILIIGWLYSGMEEGFNHYLGWVLLLLGAISLGQRVMMLAGADYGVTDHRVILKTGVIQRRIILLSHEKVPVVSVRWPLMGRLAGYGTIEVKMGDHLKSFPYVSNPVGFKIAINENIEYSRYRQIINQLKNK